MFTFLKCNKRDIQDNSHGNEMPHKLIKNRVLKTKNQSKSNTLFIHLEQYTFYFKTLYM